MMNVFHKRGGFIGKRGPGIISLTAFVLLFVKAGCEQDPLPPSGKTLPGGTTPYEPELPNYVPPMTIPDNNPVTAEGVEPGRHLFYEPLLSGNNGQSCATCHQQASSFVDGGVRFSPGIDGFPGFRNSMQLLNLGWGERFFRDGTAQSLKQLISIPGVRPIRTT